MRFLGSLIRLDPKTLNGLGGHNTEYLARDGDDAEGIATRFVGTQPKQD
jgi:hypothetical protein